MTILKQLSFFGILTYPLARSAHPLRDGDESHRHNLDEPDLDLEGEGALAVLFLLDVENLFERLIFQIIDG